MKYWKCSVCGYIHRGSNPPDRCPVCGADSAKFTEATKKEIKEYEKKQKAGGRTSNDMGFVKNVIKRFHAHPVSVHIPNGVLPMVVLFLILGYLFKSESLVSSAFYGLLYVTVAMPVVIYTGFFEWKENYHRSINKIFLTKIFLGFVVFLMGLVLVIWKIISPDVSSFTSTNFDVFLIMHIIMLAFALGAGFLGGKLVFENRG